MCDRVWTGWRWHKSESGVSADLLGVHVWDRGRAIAVGRGGACVELSAGRWRPVSTGTTEDLYAVWGASPEDVVAVGGDLKVGGQSLVCRARDGRWQQSRSGIQSLLLSVAGGVGTIVRAVGFNGGIVERVGDEWREINAGTNEHLFCIRSLSTAEWTICGINGLLRSTRAGVWRSHLATKKHLASVAETRPGEVTAVGFDGTIIRQNGDACSKVPSGTSANLLSVCATAQDAAIAVGAAGTILIGEGDRWTLASSGVVVDLFGVAARAEFAVAVGKGGTLLVGERHPL
jgi:hypothetical protein